MNYKLNKNEFEKIKREELEYIDSIAQISSNKILSETEKQDRINKIKTTWKKKTKDELKSINIKQRKTKLEKYYEKRT